MKPHIPVKTLEEQGVRLAVQCVGARNIGRSLNESFWRVYSFNRMSDQQAKTFVPGQQVSVTNRETDHGWEIISLKERTDSSD